MKSETKLTRRFEDAFVYAARLHAGQTKKGTAIPYLHHLMSVAALVIEVGGDEDMAIAALLHDAPEDCGGLPVLQKISARFGARVSSIVKGCSDTFQHPKPPFKNRKMRHIKHVREAGPEVKIVVAADKLQNLRSLTADYRKIGEPLFHLFHGKREGTLWYYTEMSKALTEGIQDERLQGIVAELRFTLARFKRLVGANNICQP